MPRARSRSRRRPTRPPRPENFRRTPRAARADAGSRRRGGRNSIRSSREECAGARAHRGSRRSGEAARARAVRAAPQGRGAARGRPRARSPSGRLSSLLQTASTVASGSISRPTARARSTKSATASAGSSGSSAYSTSPEMRSGARLVASTRRPAAVARSSATAGAASRRCSKLSRSSTSSRPRRKPPRSSGAPTACAISMGTRSRVGEAAEGNPEDTIGTVPTNSAATWSASRVLPVPPGPVIVTSRRSPSSSTSPATSRSRPRSGVAATGRFVGVERPERREVAVAELEDAFRLDQVLQSVLAEVTEPRGGAEEVTRRAGRERPGRRVPLPRCARRGARRGRRSPPAVTSGSPV